MAKQKIRFVCNECSHVSPKWLGNCPSCGAWNSFEEEVEVKETAHRARLQSSSKAVNTSEALRLEDIKLTDENRWNTGIGEFDRALGGGMVQGAYILLGGDPGIGKSTLMLQMAGKRENAKILYVSGEESPIQIKSRAQRLSVSTNQLYLSTETEVERIIQLSTKIKPDCLIIDSIQTLYRADVNSLPGSVTQIRETAVLLQQYAKKELVSTILIGHVTKEGGIAGPRLLEHMVDTVLYFEGDSQYRYRFLRTVKNRFGRTGEVGVFDMKENGLEEVKNPSALFLADRNTNISGSAVTAVLEGSRAVLLEIQALVSKANYGQPQRTANGYDHKRLAMMLAILEKRAGYPYSMQDVFLNVAGGLKTQDRGVDLAVIVALISALLNKTIRQDCIFIGEVGLGGELRTVDQALLKIEEAERMGFRTAFLPNSIKKDHVGQLQIVRCSDVGSVLNKLF
jgi:DNA repair protein RadA/Sms